MNKVVISVFTIGIILALLSGIDLHNNHPDGIRHLTKLGADEPVVSSFYLGFIYIVFPFTMIMFVIFIPTFIAVKKFGKLWGKALKDTLILIISFGFVSLISFIINRLLT